MAVPLPIELVVPVVEDGLVGMNPGVLFFFIELDLLVIVLVVLATPPMGVGVEAAGVAGAAAFPLPQTLATNFFAEAKNPNFEALGFGATIKTTFISHLSTSTYA